MLHQRDTFFKTAEGKLKLREQPDGAWLIHYARRESAALMLSTYEIAAVAEPAKMRAMLGAAFGVIAKVSKRRMLMIRDNVRLHLDVVADLGTFGEIEAVISGGDSPECSRDAVNETLLALKIAKSDLIDISYFEMLTRGRS